MVKFISESIHILSETDCYVKKIRFFNVKKPGLLRRATCGRWQSAVANFSQRNWGTISAGMETCPTKPKDWARTFGQASVEIPPNFMIKPWKYTKG